MKILNIVKLILILFIVAILINICNIVFSKEAIKERKSLITIEDRVACQFAIEKVYWRHRIWPKENKRPKPSLNSVISNELLREKVEDIIRMDNAIKFYTGKTISGKLIQNEINRIAKNTKQPQILKEILAGVK